MVSNGHGLIFKVVGMMSLLEIIELPLVYFIKLVE